MPVSKTQQIINDYRDKITSGELKPGDRLPSAAELRVEYGVSITVVRYAVGWLKAAGLAVGVPGVGVFVADQPAIEQPTTKPPAAKPPAAKPDAKPAGRAAKADTQAKAALAKGPGKAAKRPGTKPPGTKPPGTSRRSRPDG
jgi:GntR family transcriptional regulator